MHEIVRVRRNSVFSTITILSRLTVNVFIFWIIARYYGPKIFGQFTSAQVLAANFIIIADFGLDILLTTEIARNRNNALKLFRQIFSIKSIFSVTALLLMWLVMILGSFSYETKLLIFILSFYTFFSALSNYISALYKGFELLEYETKINLAMNLVLISLVLPLVLLKINIVIIACIFAFSRMIGFFVGILYSKKILQDVSFKFYFNGIQEIKSKIVVFGVFLIFNNLFFQLDTILLAIWKGDESVGIYQAAYKLIMLPLVIPDIIVNTLMPMLSRLNGENYTLWKKIGKMMNKVLIAVVVPISILIFVYAEQIILFIYGSENYENSIFVLRIFAFVLLIRFSIETYALLLTTSNKQKIRMYTVLIATLLNFLLNYFVIPKYGVWGAASVSLVTNLFVGVIYYLNCFENAKEYFKDKQILYFMSISIIIAYLCWFFRDVSMFVAVPIVILLFWVIIFYFFLSEEEKKVLLHRDYRIP
ncbi:polysaccharide biosynthesis protein [Melioribacter roseus P3M-2]|uniref:Polysaccharide biosynthesis protein n=1 Tax=Melioribacter roseus (strain DSM 23840 / JCM 17771 / VKM B-2668 / P3M-2) TaxID=1191523 RepID=I6YSM5_MELRP|nr:flippase [Melioribacter roseus]AFN73547.1 polysaccharide biosynthesis protein [Melioribacter roseus P3M-2]